MLVQATLAAARDDTAAVRRILLSSHFATFWGARPGLAQLWVQAAYADEQARLGVRSLSAVQKHRVRLLNPLPANIGPFEDFPRAQPTRGA